MSNPHSIQYFTEQLNYNIQDIPTRLIKLKQILEEYDTKTQQYYPAAFFMDYFSNYYNPNITVSMPLSDKLPTCAGLQYMAGYLIYNKNDKLDDIVLEQTQKSRNKKHISIEKIIDENSENNLSQAPTAATQPKPVITSKDRERVPPLNDMMDFISSLVKEIEETDDQQYKYKLKRILVEARQEQYTIREAYLRPINFTRLSYTSTAYTFDEDTKYKREDNLYQIVSRNQIDLANPQHVSQLLNHYSALRHQHYDEPHSDMRYILDTLDETIERSDLKQVFKHILISRIDGCSYKAIAAQLLEKYGIDLSSGYLSTAFVNHIPKKIAKTYEDWYEEWYYTFAAKGDYKQCGGDCGQNRLRTEKYFRKDKKSKDGLSSVCKICRNQK